MENELTTRLKLQQAFRLLLGVRYPSHENKELDAFNQGLRDGFSLAFCGMLDQALGKDFDRKHRGVSDGQ